MNGLTPTFAAALEAGGECGERIAGTDWADTGLGNPSTWPAGLSALVETIVRSTFPMHLSYGPNLVQIHNDAYRPVLGTEKYPAIGTPLYETFSAPHEQAFIRERFRLPLEHGRSYVTDGDRFPVDRFGWTEETFFRFTYDPFFDDDGSVAGVFTVCIETTREFVMHRRLQTLRELNGFGAPDVEPHVFVATLAECLTGRIDTPGVIAIAANDEGAYDVIAAAGVPYPPDRIELNAEELLERNGDRQMIPCEPLGLRFGAHPEWPRPPTNVVLIGCAGYTLVVALHPGSRYDADYQQFIRLVGGLHVRSTGARRRWRWLQLTSRATRRR